MEGISNYPYDENLDVNIATAGTEVIIYFDTSGTDVATGTEQAYYMTLGPNNLNPARRVKIRCSDNVIILERNGTAYKNPIVVSKPYVNTTTYEVDFGGFERDRLNWRYIKIRVETATTQLRIYAQG